MARCVYSALRDATEANFGLIDGQVIGCEPRGVGDDMRSNRWVPAELRAGQSIEVELLNIRATGHHEVDLGLCEDGPKHSSERGVGRQREVEGNSVGKLVDVSSAGCSADSEQLAGVVGVKTRNAISIDNTRRRDIVGSNTRALTNNAFRVDDNVDGSGRSSAKLFIRALLERTKDNVCLRH